MAKYRQSRINEAVTSEMAVIIREIKDPRVSDYMVSVTSSIVTPDLKYAKVYYSVLGGDDDPDGKKELARGLRSAAGFARTQLAKRLNLRVTPEITFIEDESLARGVNIAAIINSLDIKPLDEDDNEEE